MSLSLTFSIFILSKAHLVVYAYYLFYLMYLELPFFSWPWYLRAVQCSRSSPAWLSLGAPCSCGDYQFTHIDNLLNNFLLKNIFLKRLAFCSSGFFIPSFPVLWESLGEEKQKISQCYWSSPTGPLTSQPHDQFFYFSMWKQFWIQELFPSSNFIFRLPNEKACMYKNLRWYHKLFSKLVKIFLCLNGIFNMSLKTKQSYFVTAICISFLTFVFSFLLLSYLFLNFYPNFSPLNRKGQSKLLIFQLFLIHS